MARLLRIWTATSTAPTEDGGQFTLLRKGKGFGAKVTYLHQDARFGAQLLLDAGAVCVLDHERGVPAVRSWNETAG